MDSSTYSPDRLLYNTDGVRTGQESVAGSQGTVQRGTVMAHDSEDDDRLVPVDSGHETTSIRKAVCVLAETVDTDDGPHVAPVYYAGEFNADALTFGGADGLSDHRWDLMGRGIFTRKPIPA